MFMLRTGERSPEPAIVGGSKVEVGDEACSDGSLTPAGVGAATSEDLGLSVGLGVLVHAINIDTNRTIVSERVKVFMVALHLFEMF
jgi:hypothetical protein